MVQEGKKGVDSGLLSACQYDHQSWLSLVRHCALYTLYSHGERHYGRTQHPRRCDRNTEARKMVVDGRFGSGRRAYGVHFRMVVKKRLCVKPFSHRWVYYKVASMVETSFQGDCLLCIIAQTALWRNIP